MFKFNRLFNSFISRGVDYNFRNDNGFTALHYAVLKNNYEAVINLIHLKNIQLNVIFDFKLSIYGVYVGKAQAKCIDGIDKAKPVMSHTTQKIKSNEPL